MPNINMRINKNGQRVFRIRVYINGQSFQTTYPSKNEPPIPDTWSDKRAWTEANKSASAFERDCKQRLISNDKRPLAEYAAYVLNLKQTTKSIKPSTIDGYQRLLTRISSMPIGKIPIRDITVQQLNDFYFTLSQPGSNLRTGETLSPKSIREYHAFLSSVLHQAARESILAYNPAQNATLPKQIKKESNYYTAEQMTNIISAIQNEPIFWQAMTYLFIGSGARRGEILALQWQDIDFDNCRIFIRRNLVRAGHGTLSLGSPKSGYGRMVSIAPAFLTPLKLWKEEQSRSFNSKNNTRFCFSLTDESCPIKPDSVTRYYSRFGERYNLGKINPHAFRHTQASILLQDGDIVSASKRLGHSQTSTTLNIYGHMMPATDKEAADKISHAFLPQN